MEAKNLAIKNLIKATEMSFDRLLTSKGVANHQDRDDIYMTSVEIVWEKIKDDLIPLELSDLKRYLGGVVEKKLLEYYRRRQDTTGIVSIDETWGNEDDFDEPSALLGEIDAEITFGDEVDKSRIWSEQVVRMAISQLSGKARDVWSGFMDGLSMDEIATRYGLANGKCAKALKHNTLDKVIALVRQVIKTNGSEDLMSALPSVVYSGRLAA